MKETLLNKLRTLTTRRIITICLISLIGIALFVDYVIGISSNPLQDDMLTVVFIDVGQGDSQLVIASCGAVKLIDTGPRMNYRVLISYLREFNVTSIDYFILTHPHEDHFGGAEFVVRYFDVCTLLIPDTSTTVTTHFTFDRFLYRVADYDFSLETVQAGDEFYFGERGFFRILSPNGGRQRTQNDYSIVHRLEYGDINIMFTGDATTTVENRMVSSFAHEHLRSDVLVVGHHGSWTSTGEVFLAAVAPSIAVIQSEAGNQHGHPHYSVMARLNRHQVQVWRTDQKGTFVIQSDGQRIFLID